MSSHLSYLFFLEFSKVHSQSKKITSMGSGFFLRDVKFHKKPRLIAYLSRGHSFRWFPGQASAEEVDEEGVLAALERLHPVLGTGGPSGFAAPTAPPVQHYRAVGHRRLRAVAGVATRTDEIASALRLVEETLKNSSKFKSRTGGHIYMISW